MAEVITLKQHHFVLVHGGGHGAWCWIKVVPALEKAGHHVTTINMLSADENDTVDADDVTSLDQYTKPLKDFLTSVPETQKVILAGHSLGGLSIAHMSKLFPDKISVVIFLAALMPGPEELYKELIPEDPKLHFVRHSKVEGGPPTSMEFTTKMLTTSFYNKCSPEDLAIASQRVRKVPVALSSSKNRSAASYVVLTVPKVYVLGLYDKVVPPTIARKFVALHAPMELHEIEADHSLFFSAPDTIQKILLDSATKYDS